MEIIWLTGSYRTRVFTGAATSLLLALAGTALAEPYTPRSDTQVLETLPTRPTDTTARELAALRKRDAAGVGEWIDVDPTFNQPVADVTHIKLAEGDLFQQARLIPVIGKMQIDVVEEEAAAAKSE